MSEPNAPVCPECGAPRASDGTPACSCGRLASDAHRETRTAEEAAAEDFDPVRIRPFAELGGDSEDTGEPDDTTTPVFSPRATRDIASGLTEVPQLDEDERHPQDTGARAGSRRGRRTLLVAGAGAALAILLTGAFVGGLFSYDSPSRGGALPDDVRAPVPDGSAEDGNSPGEQAHSTSSASASPSPTSAPSTTPTDGTAEPSPSATPTGAPSSPGTSGRPPPPPVMFFAVLQEGCWPPGPAPHTHHRDERPGG